MTKDNLPSSFLQSSSSIELIWVSVHLNMKHGQDIILGCFYCPLPAPISVFDDLQTSLHDIKSAYPTSKIILGRDFNSPVIKWSDGTLSESYVSVSFRERLIEVTDEFHLEQLVLEPTRQYNTLDLYFTSHPTSSQTPPGLSDHEAVDIKFCSQTCLLKQSHRKIHLYTKANWEEIRSSLLCVSETYFELNSNFSRSVEENWNFLHLYCLKIIENHVPVKLVGTRSHLPWLTSPLWRLIRKKQRVYNKAKKYNKPEAWSEYKLLKNQAKHLLCCHHNECLSNIMSLNTSNKKPFWHYVKSKRQDISGISTLSSSTGTVASEPSEKAQIFSEHFKSVFTVEDLSNIPDKGSSPYPSIPEINITLQGVINLISSCNPHKSPDPDNIHATF